jgi:type VI protein secretion system component VasK
MLSKLLPFALSIPAIAAIWGIGQKLHWSVALCIILTAVVVTLVLLWFLIAWLVKRSGSGTSTTADGSAKAAVRVLENQWREAVAALRTSHPDAAAFAALPWYLVIGGPGAGKTSIMVESGLGLAPVAGPHQAGQDPRPTSSFAWWRGEDALFVDVAGRYLNDPRSQAEWRVLLRLIKGSRGKVPLNGVICCIPVGDLIQKGESAMATEAQVLRERLNEITAELGVSVPFYTVLTKCDTIGGFKDFFAGIPRPDKERVLGFTQPWDGKAVDLAAACAEENRRLFSALQTRRLRVLGRDVGDEARKKLFQFPVQFIATQRWIGELMTHLLRPNALRESARFRGLYFTSCWQPKDPPKPIAATAAAAAAAVGGNAEATAKINPPAAQPSIEASMFLTATAVGLSVSSVRNAADARLGFFLKTLLTQVVIADRGLPRPTRRAQAASLRLRFFCLVLAPLLGVGFVLWSGFSAYRHNGLVQSTRLPAERVLAVERESGGDLMRNLEALDVLGDRLERMLDADSARLEPAVRSVAVLYTRRLYDTLLSACVDRVHGDLEALRVSGGGSSKSQDQLFDLHRAYQMLGGTLVADPDVVQRALSDERRWFTAIDKNGNAPDHQRADLLASRQLKLLAAHLLPSPVVRDSIKIPIDENLVDKVNRDLGETLRIGQGYDDIIRSLSGQFGPLRVDELVTGSNASDLTCTTGFSRAFSQDGWDEAVERSIAEKSESIARTFAELRIKQDAPTIRRRLSERFAKEHAEHWLTLIASSRAANLRDTKDVPEAIGRLTGKDSPYPGFIKAALKQLSLKTTSGIQFSGFDKTEWIDQSLQAIAELKKDVAGFLAGSESGKRSADPKKVRALADRFAAIIAVCNEATGGIQPAERRAAVQDGLSTLVRSLWQPLDRELVGEYERAWVEQVRKPFADKLGSRYPFAESDSEVPMVEFSRMFNPVSGLLWNAARPIEDLRAVNVCGKPALTLNQEYQDTLARAQAIKTAFFAANSETVNAPFTITLVQRESVEAILFAVGAQKFDFYERPDARFPAFIKQGEAPACKVAIRVLKDTWKTAEKKGEWAFLRLLRDGDPKVQTKGAYLFTWTFTDNRAANTEFKACLLLDANGFERVVVGDLVTGFTVPERIAPAEDATSGAAP